MYAAHGTRNLGASSKAKSFRGYDGDEFGEIMACQPENRNELMKFLR